MWNAQLIEKPNTFPQLESMTDFSFLSLPAVVVKPFSIETEYLWFFSKRHNSRFPCQLTILLRLLLYFIQTTPKVCVTSDNLICGENTFWEQFCKTSSTLVFKYFPFSKEKAPKELTNLLALHIYKYPLNHHYFSTISYIIFNEYRSSIVFIRLNFSLIIRF